MFRECGFQLEKHYQLDIGILDLPFAGKGELRDVGTYRIFYDGESKQLFAFNEEYW